MDLDKLTSQLPPGIDMAALDGEEEEEQPQPEPEQLPPQERFPTQMPAGINLRMLDLLEEPEPEPEPEPDVNPEVVAQGQAAMRTTKVRPQTEKDKGKRRGTIKLEEFANSEMEQAARQHAQKLLSRTASGDSDRSPRTPDANASSQGGGLGGCPPMDHLTPSVELTLRTLDKCGLQRLRATFIQERIGFESLAVLVEDEAKMQELGMRYGEKTKLRAGLCPQARCDFVSLVSSQPLSGATPV